MVGSSSSCCLFCSLHPDADALKLSSESGLCQFRQIRTPAPNDTSRRLQTCSSVAHRLRANEIWLPAADTMDTPSDPTIPRQHRRGQVACCARVAKALVFSTHSALVRLNQFLCSPTNYAICPLSAG